MLDIGVGTGLLTERLLSLGDYDITGVDFSPGMLRIAQERLSGQNVRLICSDILEFESEVLLDAVVSTGGVICATAEEGEIRLYSHITDRAANEHLLAKLNRQLRDDGLLALSIQGPHTEYKKPLANGVVYSQRVERHHDFIEKWYTFSAPDGTVLAEQFCRPIFFDERETVDLLERAGFRVESRDPESLFLVSSKQPSLILETT